MKDWLKRALKSFYFTIPLSIFLGFSYAFQKIFGRSMSYLEFFINFLLSSMNLIIIIGVPIALIVGVISYFIKK